MLQILGGWDYPTDEVLCDIVIQSGADLYAKTPDGWTALDLTCGNPGRRRIARTLLKAGMRPERTGLGSDILRTRWEAERSRLEAGRYPEAIDCVLEVLELLDAAATGTNACPNDQSCGRLREWPYW